MILEEVPDDCEIILNGFSIKTKKWFFIGIYKSSSQNDKYLLDNLSLILNKQTYKYDNTMLMGDFKLTVEKTNLGVFMSTFDLECINNAWYMFPIFSSLMF